MNSQKFLRKFLKWQQKPSNRLILWMAAIWLINFLMIIAVIIYVYSKLR